MFFPVAPAPGAMGLFEISSFLLFFFFLLMTVEERFSSVLFPLSHGPLQAQRQNHGILMKAEMINSCGN